MSHLIDKIERYFNSFIARRFQKAYKKALIEVNEKYASEGIYQVFENISSISTWISDESNMVSKMIQHDSLWGAESATEKAFKFYTGYWSEKINLLLRNPLKNHLSDCEIETSLDFIKLMDDELSTRQLHSNIIVVRWLIYSNFYNYFGIPFHQIKIG